MRPEIELNAKKRYFQVEDSDGAEWFLNEENIMTQKILANFNLNQSLEEFQVSILELLQLNNVTEWSGKTIKDREEKIRETALILAGQCVAILLDNLSKSREARETAIYFTRGWGRKKTKRNGFKTR